jgi:hypothetical protein
MDPANLKYNNIHPVAIIAALYERRLTSKQLRLLFVTVNCQEQQLRSRKAVKLN